MTFKDLLHKEDIDPRHVIVLRHRPHEPELNKVLPWLAAERPEVFNAYQQTQSPRLERAMEKMKGVGYVASFIGREPGSALFVGLYFIAGSRPLTYEEYWRIPAYVEMQKSFGMKGWDKKISDRSTQLWFDLEANDFYAHWRGRLTVGWPPPERSWWRRAHRNQFPILAVLEESALDAAMPEWDEMDFTWQELRVLPKRWRTVLKQWRGVYYIFDTAEGKGYVGSAYGEDNILGRWLNYAATGHGGNRRLRDRDPENFRFTILQRVSPDMDASDVIRLESSWKQRLHTRPPSGLNDN